MLGLGQSLEPGQTQGPPSLQQCEVAELSGKNAVYAMYMVSGRLPHHPDIHTMHSKSITEGPGDSCY